jgi:hypothetical protein
MAVIRIKRSSTSGVTPNPASMVVGELVVNTADAKVWTKHVDGNLVDLNPMSNILLYVEVDFGPIGDFTASVDVSAEWVTSMSKIIVTPSGLPTDDHDPEDYVLEGIYGIPTNIIDGVGFTLLAGCKDSTFGKYIFNILGT